MPQYFRPASNTLVRSGLVGGTLLGLTAIIAVTTWNLSPYTTGVFVPIEQPVPFSHEHHVSGLGLDCRYCHAGVENTSFAGMPSTHTCMTCHSQIWRDSPMLEPVRQSLVSGEPLRWNRVHVMPGFVYFNHSIHVAKGVGCETCHGRVDKMPLEWKAQSMTMSWCLDCHRHPAKYLRPREAVWTMGYTPSRPQSELGRELVARYQVKGEAALTDCTVCHR